MKIRFFGATRSVSGSLHVIEAGARRFLLDCGLFQGRGQDMYDRNAHLPVPAASVAAVFLSHAHVDHCGNLPRLVAQGFRGPIYATRATIDLCSILLADSAYVLRTQIAQLNQRRERQTLAPLPELYGEDDVAQALRQMTLVQWDQPVQVAEEVSVSFHPAGHIVGASVIAVRELGNGGPCTLVFSGDLGRENDWLFPNPVVPGGAQHLVVESTYGDRCHRPYAYARSEFCREIAATIRTGGRVVIPAFAVGRSQRLLYELHELMRTNELPRIPVYLDSPLSIKASEHFAAHADELGLLPDSAGALDWLQCRYVVSGEESRALLERREPYIVITAAGMCEAGRVLRHLKRNLPDPASRVLFVGFCAADTLGRHLVDGHKQVRIAGETVPVRAGIDWFDTFSSHADQAGLLAWVRAQSEARSVFIVHGEEPQAFALAEQLENDGAREVVVPFANEEFTLTPDAVRCCA